MRLLSLVRLPRLVRLLPLTPLFVCCHLEKDIVFGDLTIFVLLQRQSGWSSFAAARSSAPLSWAQKSIEDEYGVLGRYRRVESVERYPVTQLLHQ